MWGEGNADHNKIAWVKWDSIWKEKKKKRERWIYVKNLEAFNSALLHKWLWRMLQNNSAPWKDIICLKYGNFSLLDLDVHNENRNKMVSTWLKDLMNQCHAHRNSGQFQRSFIRTIGNDINIRFWKDLWIENSPLCTRFKRLFALYLDKDATIEEKRSWSLHNWIWTWQ